MSLTVAELLNLLEDAVNALERIADALEALVVIQGNALNKLDER